MMGGWPGEWLRHGEADTKYQERIWLLPTFGKLNFFSSCHVDDGETEGKRKLPHRKVGSIKRERQRDLRIMDMSYGFSCTAVIAVSVQVKIYVPFALS